MTQELVYTSAPRGLKPGTQGFCTVVCTQGMSANLALQLEGLSAYRHLFPPGTPQADRNPVAYSHLCLRIGGTKYHVLSRISAAGFDYSRRSNKLAHHVVLSEKELPDRGPTWLLTQPGFMETRWDGQVKVLPTGRRIPVDPGPAGPPRSLTWEERTGDAGWSGALAETALRSQSARLICPVGLDPLPLLAEALALLPPELRWKVTFSTYFTGLPSGLECQWQCVFAGTPEELPARRSRDALVIDLTQPLPSPPESASVQAARQAQMLPLPEPSRAAQPTLLTQSVPEGTPSLEEPFAVQAYGSPQVPISPLPRLESRSPAAEVPLPTTIVHGFALKKSSRWPIILVFSTIALVLGITVGIALWILQRGPEVAREWNEKGKEASTEKETTEETKSPPAEKKKEEKESPPAEKKKEETEPQEDKPQEKRPQYLWISIPPWKSSWAKDSPSDSSEGLLKNSLFDGDIQLELIPEKVGETIFNWPKEEKQKQKWSIGRSTGPGETKAVAYFIVETGKLRFEWVSSDKWQEYQAALRDALLLVKRGNTLLGYVQLRACPKVFPIKLGNGKVPCLGNIQTKVSPQNLKIFVQLRNEKEKSVIAEAKPLPWNLPIPHPETGCELRITIELNGDALLCKQFTFIDKITPPLAFETLEKKDIKEILDYIEQRKQQLQEEIKNLSEAPQDKEKKENLDKNIKDRKDSIQNYQKVAKWLESLSQSEIHYAIYHEVEEKDSQEKSHRVYVAVSDESMLSEESPPEKK